MHKVAGSQVHGWEWTNQDFGLPHCTIKDWQASDAQESARIIEEILAGRDGPCSWIVQANAAAALWLAERVSELPAGVQMAADALATGKAGRVLDKLRSLCKDEGKCEPLASSRSSALAERPRKSEVQHERKSRAGERRGH